MKRIIPIIIAIIIIIFTYSMLKKPLNPNKLTGEIILTNSINDKLETGLLVIEPNTSNKKCILSNYYFKQAEFSNNKNQIFATLSQKSDQYTNDIYRIDSNSGKIMKSYSNPSISFDTIKSIRNLGNGIISYLEYGNLWIHNLVDDKAEIINTNCFGFSWNQEKSFFVLSSSSQNKKYSCLYEYTLNSKLMRQLNIKGTRPEFSPNSKYLCYSNDRQSIEVIDYKTNKHWTFSYKGLIKLYRFSPDSEYLAIVLSQEKKYGNGELDDGPIVIWDFKNNTQFQLIDKYNGESLDWK